MKLIVKSLNYVVLTVLGLFSVVILVSSIISPPAAGGGLARDVGMPYPAVVAHRGLSSRAPEETGPAYEIARDIGVDYLEGDVQRTRDGVLVMLHDDTLERTTDVNIAFPDRTELTIENFTFNELQQLDAGSWFNEAHPEFARDSYKNLRIIRLEDLIKIASEGRHRPGLYLETKSPERFPGIEAELVAMLTRYGWIGTHVPTSSTEPRDSEGRVTVGQSPARLIFQSFSLSSLERLRELAPDVPRVYLIDEDMGNEHPWEQLLEQARVNCGCSGIGPVGYLAWPWNLGPAHSDGLVIHPYTINKDWQMFLLSFFGSDGFFTDRADELLLYYDRVPELDTEAYIRELGY